MFLFNAFQGPCVHQSISCLWLSFRIRPMPLGPNEAQNALSVLQSQRALLNIRSVVLSLGKTCVGKFESPQAQSLHVWAKRFSDGKNCLGLNLIRNKNYAHSGILTANMFYKFHQSMASTQHQIYKHDGLQSLQMLLEVGRLFCPGC